MQHDGKTTRGEVHSSPRWWEDTNDLAISIDESIQTGEFEMSNRKPFNDCAGYVASRKNALTNIHNVIYIADEAGIDADKKYVTVCEAHGQMVSSSSLPKARIDMKDASQWCSQCQAIAGIAG